MSKAYKVTRHTIKFNKDNIHDVFSVQPVSYGLLTTDDVANQIAAESSATPGDVKNVLDRYAHYVKQNLKKGYSIELLGFGKLDIRFVKSGTVDDEKKATAALVKGMIPDFSPSFKIVNGKRIYDLMPEKISLVKYTGVVPPNNTTEETPTETPEGSGNDSDLGN
ncbi:MAG: HU family DNA-binding protein [Prevotella sp.]|nr:HU family DNA-binding protein [Prevotella sp.]